MVLVRKLDWFQINDWEGWKNKNNHVVSEQYFSRSSIKRFPSVCWLIDLISIWDILFFHLGDPGPTSPPQTFSYRKTDQNDWLIRLATKSISRLFYRSVNSIFDHSETTEKWCSDMLERNTRTCIHQHKKTNYTHQASFKRSLLYNEIVR